jgi:hypothetical protein
LEDTATLHLELFLLLFQFLLLLGSLSVNFIQWVLMSDQASLHIHKVEDIARTWVLDGSPRLGDWSFQTLYHDPEKVLICVDINSKELSVFNDLVLGGLIFIALLIEAMIALVGYPLRHSLNLI